jgi:hypothetical protein
MAGYTRQSAASITTGATIEASHLNNEFNALQTAFDAASGHSHDASAGNAPKISLTGSVTGTLPIANGGTAGATASAARTALGLAIGTDVQAYDAELAALAGLTSAADKVPYFTGSGTAAVADFSSYARTLVDDANAAAARATLELTIGTHVQAYDATLAAWAAYNTNGILTQTAADTFTGRTITGTANEITLTNGNGVSGNPTISLPTALTFTGKTVTGGTFESLDAAIAVADGGTGAAAAADARSNLGAAPANAAYITSASNSELSAENVLTAGNGISVSTATVSCDFATKAEMEADSSTTDVVSPRRVRNHPGVAKAWGYINSDGTVIASYGISTSNCRTGLGAYAITLSTAMTNTNYAIITSAAGASTHNFIRSNVSSSSAFVVQTRDSTDGANEDIVWNFMVFGTQ